MLSGSPWTPREDAELLNAARPGNDGSIDWLAVARALPGRSDRMCSARWSTLARHDNQAMNTAGEIGRAKNMTVTRETEFAYHAEPPRAASRLDAYRGSPLRVQTHPRIGSIMA